MTRWILGAKLKVYLKKTFARVVFFLTGFIIYKRKNELTQQDVYNVLLKVRIGDIVLTGTFNDASSLVIPGAVTHAAIYVGGRRVIHSVEPYVKYESLHQFLTQYDTIAIVRLPRGTKHRLKILHKVLKFARNSLGKPYGFKGHETGKKTFCTKFVNKAFEQAGHTTKLRDFKKFAGLRGKIGKLITIAINALRPEQFFFGNFKVVFLSHNLQLKGKQLALKKKS